MNDLYTKYMYMINFEVLNILYYRNSSKFITIIHKNLILAAKKGVNSFSNYYSGVGHNYAQKETCTRINTI